jgi:predicted acylesterase/phospholipase RssA
VKEFEFPADAPDWPVYDTDAGIVFPRGGMRGIWHTGAIHAFVVSGYFPTCISGTSIGAASAAGLAVLGKLTTQSTRLEMLREWAALWMENPGKGAVEAVRVLPALQKMGRDLLATPVSLRDLVEVGQSRANPNQPFLRRVLPVAKVVVGLFRALPWRSRRAALGALASGALARLRYGQGDLALRQAQALLSSYGFSKSLLPESLVDQGFSRLLKKYTPDGAELTLGDCGRCHLSLQVADVRLRKSGRGGVVSLTEEAGLISAVRAANALPPLTPAVCAGEVLSPAGLARLGLDATDPLVDAVFIDGVPLGGALKLLKKHHSTDQDQRLFVLFTDPVGGVEDDSTGFIGPHLHSFYLNQQRGLSYNVTVVRLITELLREGGMPEDEPGDWIRVDPIPIAPVELLRFNQFSVPESERLTNALSSGCRSSLEVLHASTLRRLGDGTVPCQLLMDELQRCIPAAAEQGFFVPEPSMCQGCTRQLRVLPAPEPEPEHAERPHPLEEVTALQNPKAVPRVIVPAGGVFLGVFQIGAALALRHLNPHPDPTLYAGASVGTLFSLLLDGLQSGIQPDGVIAAMMSADEWVDEDEPPRPGRLDRAHELLKERLSTAPVRALLALEPSDLADLLDGGAQEAVILAGLQGLLFPEMSRADLVRFAKAFSRLDLEGAKPFVEALVQGLGGADLPTAPRLWELVGFEGIRKKFLDLVLQGAPEALNSGNGSRFLFSVTDHTHGQPRTFGGRRSDAPLPDHAPDTLEAALAASSFPVAFKLRPIDVVYPAGTPIPPGEADVRFADGGIFNNFPADTALRFLRHLSQFPEYRHLGKVEIRFLLMTLDFPTPLPQVHGREREGVFAGALAWMRGQHDKLDQVLKQQSRVQRLAGRANKEIRARQGPGQRKQAILADFDIIAPAKRVYPHAFTFKSWLGFSEDRQQEMMADGCRRTFYADSWRYQRDGLDLESFDRIIRRQIRWSSPCGSSCVLGLYGPKDEDGAPVPCVFITSGDHRSIRRQCRKTALKDLKPEALPTTSRVDLWMKTQK